MHEGAVNVSAHFSLSYLRQFPIDRLKIDPWKKK
jgi:hypothetical protein